MKLYFLRHSERGHGPEQDTLTPTGIEQAKKSAKYLRNIKIDKIISGSSQRARRTAEEIIKLIPNCPVEYTSEINEQSLGVLQGKSGKEYEEALTKSGKSPDDFRPENGENRTDAYKRAKNFVNKLKKETAESILIISHSGFISDVCTILLNLPMGESKNFKTDFCAITYFELDKGFKVKRYFVNCTNHLNY